MTGPGVFASAAELSRERGWPLLLISSRQCAFKINRTTRLALQARGLITVVNLVFPLDPDAPLDTSQALARVLGGGLAEVTLAVTGRVN